MSEPLRILILEDNPADAEMIQYELTEAGLSFTAKVVMTEKSFVHEIEAYCPELILSDYDLPTYNGALALAETKRRCPDTPFILVTGAVTEDRAIEILTQGAKDYVLKTRLQQRLVPAVRRALAEAEELRARKQAEEELREAHRTLEERVKIRTAELEAEMAARKKTEDALRTSEILYHSLFDGMLNGFAYCKMIFEQERPQDFIYLEVNRAFESLTGLKNVVGKKVSEIIPGIKESDADLFEAYGRVALTGKPERFEKYLEALKIWFSISVYSPARGYFVAIFDVITARKQTEENLRVSEQRFRTLAEEMQHFVWEADINGVPLYANKRFYDYTGLDLEQVQAGGWLAAQHPEDSPKVEAAWRRALITRSGYDLESRFREATTGKYRWFRIKGSPVRDATGRIFRWVGTCTDIHEQKQAEKALRESEQRLKFHFENSPLAVVEWDTDFIVTQWSKEAERMFGWKKEEVIGKRIDTLNMIYVDDIPLVNHAMERLVSGKEHAVVSSNRNCTKTGTVIECAWHNSVLFNAGGQLESVMSLVEDITERRQVEAYNKQLQDSVQREKDRLSALINSMSDEVWFVDTQKRFTLANPSAIAEFRLNSGNDTIDVQKLAAGLDVYRPDGSTRPVEEAPPLRALSGEIVRSQEEIVRTPRNGTLHYREVNSAPVRDADGTIIGSVSVVRDITERKRAEMALRDSERLHRAIGESIDYGVWVCAPDGRNIYASESFLRLVGLTQEQCSNFGWGDVLHPDEAERTIAAWKECVRTGSMWDIEHRFRGVDGQWHPILARGVPVRNERGEVIYWAGINLDIRKLKQAEMSIKERTQQLENANKELESFSYSISHDLRAPLRAIDGYARMILKQQGDKFDEKTMRLFDVIRNNTKMMEQLIDDLLALSRLGKEALSLSQLNMEDLFRDAWEEQKAVDPDRSVDLKIGHIPPGIGDRLLIRQVLINILSNAIKFTRIREVPLIEVGGYAAEKENVYYIRDNGVGFDMQYHDKLFGVFQRLHSAADYEGTGVGLAIVQRIILRHGGRVWAESEKDKGATFYFSLSADIGGGL